MTAIGPGDFVEAVDDLRDVRGHLTTACSEDCGQPRVIEFHDAPNPGTFARWCVCGFRPIYRPKGEVFQAMLIKALEPADA